MTYEIVKFKNVGVEIQLHQSLAHRSWVKVIVNPSSLLAGEYCPTRLFRDVKKIPKIRKKLQEILDECGIAVKLKDFKLNRVDLTRNEYFDSGDEMDARLDIFKKSYPIPHYKAVSFGEFFNDDNTYEDADKHSWTIACKDKNKKLHCEFSVYDKGYELEKRHGIIIDDHILRKELRLGQNRIRQLAKSSSWEDQLADLIKQRDKLMDKFLRRLHQDHGKIVTAEEAVEIIEVSSFRTKTKKKMGRIVKLAAKSESLIEVRKKMKIRHEQFKKLLDRFQKLEISPIPIIPVIDLLRKVKPQIEKRKFSGTRKKSIEN